MLRAGSVAAAYGADVRTKSGSAMGNKVELTGGSNERKVLRAMKITGTEALKNRTVDSLSGGQRQRAFITMALAQNTDILLLEDRKSTRLNSQIGRAHV